MPWVHGTLDVAGFLGPIGPIADGVNTLIFVVEGNYVEAGTSAFAMVPVWGDAYKAGRISHKAIDAFEEVSNLAKGFLGPGYKAITNKSGDNVFMSSDGLRKMRFDLLNPGGDRPHVHLEIYKNNDWYDAIKGVHRIYPQP